MQNIPYPKLEMHFSSQQNGISNIRKDLKNNKKICHYKFIQPQRCKYRQLKENEMLNDAVITQKHTFMSGVYQTSLIFTKNGDTINNIQQDENLSLQRFESSKKSKDQYIQNIYIKIFTHICNNFNADKKQESQLESILQKIFISKDFRKILTKINFQIERLRREWIQLMMNQEQSQETIKNEEKIIGESENISTEELEIFKEHSKNNTFKNILCAFQRHIEDLQDQEMINNYESLTEDNWIFDYIKIRVNQNLKNCGRFHLKMKNLLTSKNLKCVFENFLKSSNTIWLEQSKIKDKEKLKESIEILIKATQNKAFVENISFYKKSKRKY